MATPDPVLNRFTGQADVRPAYMADLSLWYGWHKRRRTLPAEWRDMSLVEVSQQLGSPAWCPVRPWRLRLPSLEVVERETPEERVIEYHTPAGTLTEAWKLGPDGDWWQTEFPVKSGDDMAAAVELANARTYVPDPGEWQRARAETGDLGIVAIELPRAPLSDLLHAFFGWSDGWMMLMGDEGPIVQEILTILEQKRRLLVEEMALLPGPIVLCPDNLDGQFISPYAFADRLAPSYRHTADVMHRHGKWVVVHVGGACRHLMAPLADIGVDAVQGVAGPPQSNATLAEARKLAGPGLTLWGGVPQDLLMEAHSAAEFEASLAAAREQCAADGRMILGVADRVPVEADVQRLRALGGMV